MFKFLKSKKNNNEKRTQVVEIVSPITGKAIDIDQTPDVVFAEKMVGDGVAIEPTDGLVVAPCAGKVVQIFPTNHAVGIETKEGFDILIHIGIDTVELDGDGFVRLVEEGQRVEVGTPIIEVDLDAVAKHGKSTVTPVIITTMDKIQSIDATVGDVKAGEDVIMRVEIK